MFPTFITTHLPIGLVGLMIAAIFAAAMSASGGELNALATATVIDFYRRHFVKEAADSHYLRVSKLATMGWGLFACVRGDVFGQSGLADRSRQPLRLVLLRLAARRVHPRDSDKRATRDGAFCGLIAGMVVVLIVAFATARIAFLWHNLIGAVVVVVVGMAISAVDPRRPAAPVDLVSRSRLRRCVLDGPAAGRKRRRSRALISRD